MCSACWVCPGTPQWLKILHVVPHFLKFYFFKQDLAVNVKKVIFYFLISFTCLLNKNNVLMNEYSINVCVLKIKKKQDYLAARPNGMCCTHLWNVLHTLMECSAHPNGMCCTHLWNVLHALMECAAHTYGMCCTP